MGGREFACRSLVCGFHSGNCVARPGGSVCRQEGDFFACATRKPRRAAHSAVNIRFFAASRGGTTSPTRGSERRGRSRSNTCTVRELDRQNAANFEGESADHGGARLP